jgi:hypothetical protein
MAGRRFGLCDAGEADVVYIRRSLGRPEGNQVQAGEIRCAGLLGANPGSRDSCAGAGGIG